MNTAMNTRWDVLWRDFIGGDESAGGKLFELLFPQMTLTAFSVLKDWELARDQAADVWLKLLETEDKALSNGDHGFTDQARWYLGVSALQLNECQDAKSAFQFLANQEAGYRAQESSNVLLLLVHEKCE